jgi:uncharacterized protein
MELTQLIAALSEPSAYPQGAEVVEVHQTHVSVVFLAGPYAYKIKKPLNLGYLDYSTLAKRREFCEQEVVLNRRLAPTVYLGVVPVSRDGTAIKMDGSGETIEWAVKMTRLPDEATLRERLGRDEIDSERVAALAHRIAEFHAHAASGPHISAAGRFETVARNARENFEQSTTQVGATVSRTVFERLRRLTEEALAQLRPLIETRAARSVPRDTHGDLRLSHVYFFPERPPPNDFVIVDCIEFNERFRHADPVADMAFLVMDFARHDRRELASDFADAYFRASGDEDGRPLLSFYCAYRAAVRGKVEGLTHTENEIPTADRATALEKSRVCWLLALGELERPRQKPCLVLIGGLPGTGKSTLARPLAQQLELTVIRSDVVRKELAGLAEAEPAAADFGEGIYTRDWDEQTYAECARRADALLFEGKRVLVDASFGREENRGRLLELAATRGVPAILLVCRAAPEVVRERLNERRNDVSDADWSIYLAAAARFEPPDPKTRRFTMEIVTDGDQRQAVSQAVDVLRNLGLA